MQSVTNLPFMPSVIMLNVIMLGVVMVSVLASMEALHASTLC